MKVLDFGLAKAMEPDRQRRRVVSQSPTITTPAMTQARHDPRHGGVHGARTGEGQAGRQARATSGRWVRAVRDADRRRAFEGDDVSDTLASVLKSEPEWNALPTEPPRSIRALLRRCLEKDRKRRLDSAAAARLEIEDALTTPALDAVSPLRPCRPSAGGAWRAAHPQHYKLSSLPWKTVLNYIGFDYKK